MKTRKSRKNLPTIPYLSGEERLEQINREGNDEFVKLYGVNPWFFKNPELPPPHNKMPSVIVDDKGRQYNFPKDKPNAAHVKLSRAPKLSDGRRDVLFPELGEIVLLADKRSFIVKNILVGDYRVATATLFIEWVE